VLAVSLLLQNLHPSVITRSFEFARMFHFKSLVGVLISLYYSNIRIFSGDKIRRRIRISAAAWSGCSSFSLSAARRSSSFPAGTQTLSKRLYNVYDCV